MTVEPFTLDEATILRAAANLLAEKGRALTDAHDPLAHGLGFLGRELHDVAGEIARVVLEADCIGMIA